LAWGKETFGFKEIGFLPKGLINYLALLGWNSGTEREVYELQELENAFGLDGIQKGGARFDFEKAKWINHQHIIKLETHELKEIPIINDQLKGIDEAKQLKLLELLKERLFTLEDLKNEMGWIHNTTDYDEKVVKKLTPRDPAGVLQKIFD